MMRFSIRYKLLLILLLSTALVVAVMLGFTNWSFQRGFIDYVEQTQRDRVRTLVSQLAEIYGEENGWKQLAGNQRRWARLVWNRTDDEHRDEGRDSHRPYLFRSHRADNDDPRLWPPRLRDRSSEQLPFAFRVMLFDADKQLIFGRPERTDQARLYPIIHDGAEVGYLGVLPGPTLSQVGEIRFLERQRHAFILIGITMLALSGILALLMASRLMRPLRAFTEGARALAAGRYDTRIPVQSRDELGQLARDFNELAKALAQNERQRRQWVADISHELRTPLAVMRGELEALQDGVRPLTLQAITSLHADTLRLGRLVDDLYELSRSDLGALDYHKAPTDPISVLAEDIDALRHAFVEQSLDLSFENQLAEALTISADPDRLSQLYRNLLSNSLHYTDPGGRVRISVQREGNRLLIDIEDSAPGVAAEHLPKLFDRLYRVEPSRSRAHGGAGLGLAICRNIAEAHGGTLTAQPSSLGGLWVRLSLPLQP